MGLFDWNSVNKATEIYSKLHDDGAEFARELMIYYVIGGGKPFLRGQYYIVDTIMDHGNPNDSAWAKFMKSRAEISVRMNQFYNTLAEELRHNFNLKGDFNKNALNIELTQESMLLTLHGSRGIKVRGQFEKCCKNSICKIIFQKVTWSWIDGIGDKELLQPGNSTLLNSGEVVPDSLFLKIGIGQTYPIVIQWTDDNVSIPK